MLALLKRFTYFKTFYGLKLAVMASVLALIPIIFYIRVSPIVNRARRLAQLVDTALETLSFETS
jgi:hypothetical protein